MDLGKKLNKKQLDFLTTLATKVVVGDKLYMYVPYWIEIFEDGQARLHSMEKVPQELKDAIGKIRT